MHAAWSRSLRQLAAVVIAPAALQAPLPLQKEGWPTVGARRSHRKRQFFAFAEVKPSLVTNWADPKKATKLEANYQTREVIEQRRQIQMLLNLHPGERLLDVGCGPGFQLEELSDIVGCRGHLDGVDPSEAMLNLAKARLGGRRNCEVKKASAEALPYEDCVFDAVILSQVLLYVEDVPKALGEAKRVLKPGGRLVICDTDWDSLVANTGDRDRFHRLKAACCSTFLDAHLPPKLPGLLAEAGLQLKTAKTCAMMNVGHCGEPSSSWIANWALNVVPEKASAFGLDKADIDGWLAEQHKLSERGAFFACVSRFLFVAEKS